MNDLSELHLPWLELIILIPFLGACCAYGMKNHAKVHQFSVVITGLTLICALGMAFDFWTMDCLEAYDRGNVLGRLVNSVFPKVGFTETGIPRPLLKVDRLDAPLLPLVALLYFLTVISTLRAKIRQFTFASKLLAESLALALYCCDEPSWGMIVLLILGTVPPYLELKLRGKSPRVYLYHMGLFSVLLVMGWALVGDKEQAFRSSWGIIPLLLAVFIRSGIAPFHCWMTNMFEHATFGSAVLHAVPLAGAYAAVRLVLPNSPDWVLHSLGIFSLMTAVYAAGMALVQQDGRRFFCYLFLSHSALISVGMLVGTDLALTGALCVWLSVALALGGFGLTLRALEARHGRLSLNEYQGLYEHTPNLAMCFVLTGLASVGFPGTFGFVGTEILFDAAVDYSPLVGITVILAAALNGIAIIKVYFRLFTGITYSSSVSLMVRVRERYAVLTLAALILMGGFYPQPHVASRHRAAQFILEDRESIIHPK